MGSVALFIAGIAMLLGWEPEVSYTNLGFLLIAVAVAFWECQD